MNRERTDLDIPEETVWPATGRSDEQPEPQPTAAPQATDGPQTDEQPVSLDPDRDDAERNAAAGGWDGANEQIENDFETEQLRRAQAESADEDVPLT